MVVKFVLTVIFSPSLWKIAIIFFLKQSSLAPFAFSITENQLSLYKLMFFLSMIVDDFPER